MATRFPEIEPTNSFFENFTKVEEEINSLFETFIKAVRARRDQLLLKLNGIKQDYFDKEETRNKQLEELQSLIQEATQEPDVRTINRLEKCKKPTHLPIPMFRTEDPHPLLQQIEGMGSVEDVVGIYAKKLDPFLSMGRGGVKKGGLNQPLGIGLEGERRIYFCDSWNSRIQVFSRNGTFRKEFGKGQLVMPHSIVLHDNCALVSDWGQHAVFKFRMYRFVCRSPVGVLSSPRVLTTDENREVFVADCNNNRIAVLNSELQFLNEIGDGKLKSPSAVKIHLNEIFVADESKPHNVHVFSKSADLLYSFINLRSGNGYIFMCFDKFNNILISDSEDKSIQIFTIKGQLLYCIKCGGNPAGIEVTNDNTIVCAMRNLHSIKFY